MTRNDDHRIADILDAGEKLRVRLDGAYEDWLADEDLRLVTERLVEVIGEAARVLSDEVKSRHPTIDWSGFVGLRNVLVHAYHRVQPDLLWRAATVDVPHLLDQLRPTGEAP